MKLMMKRHRVNKRFTLQELANLLGCSKGYLSLIENNKTSPRLITIKKIGYALEICPKKLIDTCMNMNQCTNCHYK